MTDQTTTTRPRPRPAYLEIWGDRPEHGFRLEYVWGLVEHRLEELERRQSLELLPPAWKTEPAFELHIRGGLAEIVSSDGNLLSLREIVERGEKAHVVVILHEDLNACTEALAGRSGRLAADLVEGRALRHAATPPGRAR